MRLFFALTFDSIGKHQLKQIQNLLKSNKIKGRYIHASLLHITLAFIGNATLEQQRQLIAILRCLNANCPPLTIDHLGTFPQKDRQIAWLGVEDNTALTDLQQELTHHLKQHGFVIESRQYVPHITVARHVDKHAQLSHIHIKSFCIPIRSIALMESKMVKNTLVYQEVEQLWCKTTS